MVTNMVSEVQMLRSRYQEVKAKRDALRAAENFDYHRDDAGDDQSQDPEYETRSVTPVRKPEIEAQDSVEMYRQDSQVTFYSFWFCSRHYLSRAGSSRAPLLLTAP